MNVTRAPQVVLKRMSSISFDFRVNLSCSEVIVGGTLYWQRSYHSAFVLAFIKRKANSMRHRIMLDLSQYISMKGNLCEQVYDSFTQTHQYCTQANNSWAQVAIHKLQFKQASNSRTPGSISVTQVQRIFFYMILNGFRISRWMFISLCR